MQYQRWLWDSETSCTCSWFTDPLAYQVYVNSVQSKQHPYTENSSKVDEKYSLSFSVNFRRLRRRCWTEVTMCCGYATDNFAVEKRPETSAQYSQKWRPEFANHALRLLAALGLDNNLITEFIFLCRLLKLYSHFESTRFLCSRKRWIRNKSQMRWW